MRRQQAKTTTSTRPRRRAPVARTAAKRVVSSTPPSSKAAEAAIGIFDSGVGGLTVAQQVMQVLPHEHLIYFGDTARYPYGSKSAEIVRRYAVEDAQFLVDKGVKMLVVACNTVASTAMDTLREHFDLPMVGVIEPGARRAAEQTRNRKVGVIGTDATIASGAYTRALRRLLKDAEVYTRACPLFVPLAEEGWVDNDVAGQTAAAYLNSLRRSGIDTLLLGCTHYPLLEDVIARVMGDGVTLVDSARTTAAATADLLAERGLARRRGDGSISFFVSDVPDRFVKIGARFMGQKVESAVRIER
jgi:glutamate racemase